MADPIFMLSLVDANEAAELDVDFAAAPLPSDAFARAYGPFIESLASLPLLIEPSDVPRRIAG